MKLLVLSLLPVLAIAAEHPKLLSGLGEHHHPITTESREAQAFFDQGLKFIYAFNHGEALRSFTRASELDREAPMPQWGIALALGPHLNLGITPEKQKAARAAIHKAIALLANGTAAERAYVKALSIRYAGGESPDDPVPERRYRDAMRKMAAHFPDDLDAATLFVESAMNAQAGPFWTKDGNAAPEMQEVLTSLERVLERNPNHPGANHYYIHAVEGSADPGRALACARRLETLAPEAGHLLHMPAHIYFRLGDYAGAVRVMQAAAKADQEWIDAGGSGDYALLYYHHNLRFLVTALSFQGRFAEAHRVAIKMEESFRPYVKALPSRVDYLHTSTFVLLRFQRWAEILRLPEPAYPPLRGMWHFARGMALAATEDPAAAKKELHILQREADAPDVSGNGCCIVQARPIRRIAALVLQGRIAFAEADRREAITLLREAVSLEDDLSYQEPPPWPLPVREMLGQMLLMASDPAAAEAVFTAELSKRPCNPRALFGLAESLRAQQKAKAAAAAQTAFEQSWTAADGGSGAGGF